MRNIISFKEIFNNSIFRIPDYQRGYSWTQKELDDLWADLTNTHLYKNSYHFTGILTLNTFNSSDLKSIKEEGFNVENNKVILNGLEFNTFNLVDGQQRLTTILILLSRLIQKIKNTANQLQYSRKYFFVNEEGINKYIFGYHIDVPSHNFLIRDIFEDPSYSPEKTETLYTHNLLFAKKYFEEKLKDFSQNEIQDMITKITDRLLFSILNLSESENTDLDISMIFETLNFRGKQLSGLERFKNRVMYLLSKQPINQSLIISRRKSINDTWLEVYKWLGRNNEKRMDDDAFLKAFWLLYFANEKMVSKDFKAYQKNLFEIDFSLMNINDNSFMKPDTLPKWLKTMKRAVRLWYFINNPYEVDGDTDFNYLYTDKIQRSLYRLNSFPYGYGKYMQNLILALLIKDLPEENVDIDHIENSKELVRIERILWMIERHNILCFLLNGNKTNFNQESTFRDVNKYFKEKIMSNGFNIQDTILEKRITQFNWDNVKRNILQGKNFYSWDGIHFILREYEEIISGERVVKDVALNFIYPEDIHKLTRGFFPAFKRIHATNKNKYTYSLGNIYISNNYHVNKDFESIQNRIATAIRKDTLIYHSEKELLDMEEWTPEKVIHRGTHILNTVLDFWDIPHPRQDFYQSFLGH